MIGKFLILTIGLGASLVAGDDSSSTTSSATSTSSTTQSASSTSSSVSGTSTSTANTTSTSTTSTNPLIPSTLTSTCIDFLNTLNSDSTLHTCTSSILNVVSAFNPVSGSISSGDVNKALNSLCNSGQVQTCTGSYVNTLLSNFEKSCSTELSASAPTADQLLVRFHYDLLYASSPFTGAMCSIDTKTKTFCLTEIVSGTAPSGASSGSNPTNDTTLANSTTKDTSSTFNIGNYVNQQVFTPTNLYYTVTPGNENTIMPEIFGTSSGNTKRDDSSSSGTFYLPNLPLMSANHFAYLFLSPNMDSSMLCTQCTQTVLIQYLQAESSHPYYSGISSSLLLSSQSELYNSLGGKCGSGFVSNLNAAMGDNGDNSGAMTNKITAGTLMGLIGVLASLL